MSACWRARTRREGCYELMLEPIPEDPCAAYRGGPTQVSAGGGQMVTCREMARIGQLMLNKGKWLDKTGAPFQMAAEKHIDAMMKPAYPGVIDGCAWLPLSSSPPPRPTAAACRLTPAPLSQTDGLLTWLNTDMTKGNASHCEHAAVPHFVVHPWPPSRLRSAQRGGRRRLRPSMERSVAAKLQAGRTPPGGITRSVLCAPACRNAVRLDALKMSST